MGFGLRGDRHPVEEMFSPDEEEYSAIPVFLLL
jgi:hypothetical protein